ncbi:hypothetical protein P154DRAFT_229938 [Amniculicola lignicola CBS 123094]|uniref:Transcriptional regulatory protein DEP1 n=1 Tax=Amniculicola lignicola CBS 123094 TaxID=1392246 RepID=A0A6A5WBX0_9PLEO|nr:hypothetical protein P154DRAFT_229938 [Amniculicola lignicola CBS 123094]
MADTKDGLDDLPDNRSSSLSELGDASDDQSEPTPRAAGAAELPEPDSEAETERMETTPRKLQRTATDTSIASDRLYQRTPSKLAYSKTVDEDGSAPPTPSDLSDDEAIGDLPSADAALHALSIIATSDAGLPELGGKKRKRSSADSSSVEEPLGAPARKRSSTAKSATLNGSQEVQIDNSEQVDEEEDLANAEDRLSQLAHVEIELEEAQADVATETVNELAVVAKLTKPRKGPGRRKRKVEDVDVEIVVPVEPQEVEGDGDNEEEDSATHDEEVSKKKSAIDQLATIERKFKIFREKLCDEQIAKNEQELEMLKQPNCTHPEYLALIKSIDDRRAEKIAHEKTLMNYKQKSLEIRTVAERHQLHSQYFQTVREIREEILAECNQRIYELQKGRRQLGVEEIEYAIKLPEKRSERIRQQAAYNLEVSILAGVAKYVGFPAAPDIKPAHPVDIEDDLRAMKITTRVPAPAPYVRAYNRPSAADEAAAEEQFIERTPWANPQHPAHQQSHYAPGPSRIQGQPYQTPAGQRRVVDVHAPNGSASTIDVMSNPPSSATGPGLHSTGNGRIGDSESPVLQMKRHPGDHLPLTDSPGSHPRNLGALGRESYASTAHMMSSPATSHMEQVLSDEHSARWGANGSRPLHASTPNVPPGPPIPGRAVPLSQRNNLGTVSVGSGSSLFGR